MKNYKKLLVLSISALMVFGIASCEKPTPSESVTPSTQPSISDTTVTETNFAEDAANYIFASMKDTVNRMADFELPTVNVQWDGDTPTNVNMTWSLEVKEGGLDGAISLGEPVDGNYPVTVVYNADFSTKATEFVLKCKFVDAYGNEAEIELPGVVPVFKYATYAEFEKAVKEESKEVLNVLGTVTAVYKSGPFIVDEDGYGFYAYAPTGVSGQAELFAAYPVGSKVLVSGTATSYNGQSEFAKGCTVKLVEAAPANYEIPYADKTAEFASATSTKDGAALGELQNTVVELKDVTIQDKDLTNYYYYFTVGESDVKFYLRTSGSYNDFTNDAVNAIVEEWVAGYKANLKGLVQVYNNAYYLTPIELDNAVEITERALSNEQIIVNGITAIDATIEESYSKDAEIVLPATDETGIAYSYTVKEGSAGIAISDGKLVVTPGSTDQTGTLVVKGSYNGVEKEVEIVIAITKKGMNLLVSSELKEQGVDTSANGNKVSGAYYAGGYIKSISSTKYGNMHIVDQNGEDIYLYGLYSADGSVRFDAMTEQPQVGDFIFVYSDNVTYYNGYQLGNAKLLGNLGEVKANAGVDTILDAGKDLTTNNQEVEGTYAHTIAGVVTSIASDKYGNLYIEDAEGNSLYVYGLYSVDGQTRYDAMTSAPQVGDYVVITVDKITYYNGIQAKNAKLNAFYSVSKESVEVKATHTCVDFTDPTCTEDGVCTFCGEVGTPALGHTEPNAEGNCERCGENITEINSQITASKTMAELIAANGWTTTTTKQSFNLDENVTVKIDGGSNTGKAYNEDHIRIYATDTPAGTITISVPDGYELVSVKVSAQTGTYAFLCVDGTSTDICNVVTEVSGSSVVLNSVKNGKDGKQVRVTAIEVVYKAA